MKCTEALAQKIYKNDLLLFVIVNILIMEMFAIVFYFAGFEYTPENGVSQIKPSLERLLEKGDLYPELFNREARRLSNESLNTNAWVVQDMFAMTYDSKLIQKHSIISIFFTAPFFYLLDDIGILFFQQLVAFSCLLISYLLIKKLANKKPLILTTLCFNFLTPIHYGLYSYVHWYDTHGLALIILSLFLTFKNSPYGAFFGVMSILVRPSNAIFLPLNFIMSYSLKGKRGLVQVTIGASAGIVIVLLWNYIIFGGIAATAYSNLPSFSPEGEMVILKHALGFNYHTFISDWGLKLFSPTYGWFVYSPLLLFLPLYLNNLFNVRYGFILSMITLFSLIYSIYIFSYPFWSISFIGNRFLLPATFLLYIVLITLFVGDKQSKIETLIG